MRRDVPSKRQIVMPDKYRWENGYTAINGMPEASILVGNVLMKVASLISTLENLFDFDSTA
jgi:hypothetical protein